LLQNLKYFFKHTLIYSINNIATKASGVILLPIYSAYLSLGDFGILGVIEVTILILVDLINLGLAQSLVMMNNMDEYAGKKKEILFTIFSISFLICVLFTIAGEFLLPSIAALMDDPARYYFYLRITLYVISFRILNNILLNKLRAEEKSGIYTIAGIFKLLLTIGFVIFFVAVKKMNVDGILYAYLISEIVVLAILIPMLINQMSVKFNSAALNTAVQFGVPLIFGSLAMMLLNLSDRYIIKYFLNNEMVGLYDLGYRVAGVLNMFVIVPLSLTLIPQAYKMFGKAGDKRYYSKLLTYLTFGLSWIGLGIALFSKEAIKFLAQKESFWPSYEVVPVITLASVFFGMRIVSSLGMYLNKKTKYVAYTTVAAAAINIALNIIFIPKFGMMAATYTRLISFVFLYLISYYYGNLAYKIPFENIKIAEVLAVGIFLYSAASYFNAGSLSIRLTLKTSALIVFPLILYFLKFYEPIELIRIKGFYLKWKNPAKWGENLKSFSFDALASGKREIKINE